MAQPTATHSAPPASMAATPGISPGVPTASLSVTPVQGNRSGGEGSPSMGATSQSPDIKPAQPFLFSDLEPVAFIRLYPHEKDGSAAALKAGKALYDAKPILAAQQDDGDRKPDAA